MMGPKKCQCVCVTAMVHERSHLEIMVYSWHEQNKPVLILLWQATKCIHIYESKELLNVYLMRENNMPHVPMTCTFHKIYYIYIHMSYTGHHTPYKLFCMIYHNTHIPLIVTRVPKLICMLLEAHCYICIQILQPYGLPHAHSSYSIGRLTMIHKII